MIPRIDWITHINDETEFALPEFTKIVERNEEGKINLNHLDDLLTISERSLKYNKDNIMKQMMNKTKNDYIIRHFIKVATLGQGFEFGADAIIFK